MSVNKRFGTLQMLRPNTPGLPTAAYGSDDQAVLLGMWVPALAASTVLPSIGVLTISEDVVTYLSARDGLA